MKFNGPVREEALMCNTGPWEPEDRKRFAISANSVLELGTGAEMQV